MAEWRANAGRKTPFGSVRAVSKVVSRGRESRRAAARSDCPGDGDARRPAVGAHGAASRLQSRRIRVLHQLQQPKSCRPLREPACCDRVSLAGDRTPGARGRPRRKTFPPRVGSIFSESPPQQSIERVGVATERTNFRTIVSRSGVQTGESPFCRSRHSVPAVLGRLSNCRKLYRVLAGTTVSTARSHRVSQERKNLDENPPWTLAGKSFRSDGGVSNCPLRVVIRK
jgi:hypothetical protein